MSDNMYGLIWDDVKSFFQWLLVLGVISLGIYGLCQDRNTVETIKGHEYIRHVGYYTDDIEHSPDCWCQKNTQP